MRKNIVLYTLGITGILIVSGCIPLFSAHLLPWEAQEYLAVNHPITGSDKRDSSPPTITITYAGNALDRGGPYYRPPAESGPVAADGYYTNDSKQSEKYIVITCQVTDDTAVEAVWLQWLNGTTWTKWTYKFTQTSPTTWQFNSLGVINTKAGYRYSFDVAANDTTGNSRTVPWNKTGLNMDGKQTRRYVQLNNTPQSIVYTPLYFYNADYKDNDLRTPTNYTFDRMHHDQGVDGTLLDTGYLQKTIPTTTISLRYSPWFVGYWFDETMCVQSFVLNNIYYHFWYNTSHNELDQVGWKKDRKALDQNMTNMYYTNKNNARSSVMYGIDFYLDARLLKTTSTMFSDNDIYELALKFREDATGNPIIISNRSILSFVLLNVPDNKSLNSTYVDSDTDGLTDWTELYKTYTNPFLADTDYDGFSDQVENQSGTDPNNYQNFPLANQPPYVPSNPSPGNGATGVSINADLSWTGGDPDVGDTVTYDVYFGTTSPPPKIFSNYTSTTYLLSTLAYSTQYYWKIVSWDNHGAHSTGPIWSFTTQPQPNNPPNVPSNPNPPNGATSVSINADLGWTGGDPDPGDTVTYDVFFGTTSPPPKVIGNQSSTTYILSTLLYSTQYYWKIVSWDNHGAHTVGPIWSFTTEPQPNNPPNVPSNPYPPNGATGIDINADLSWTGGDPDPGDTVTYDIYFGTSSNPPKLVSNHTQTSYNLGTLLYNTRYYWKIVSWDNHGAHTTGPVWTFVTMQQPNNPPNIPSNPSPPNGATGVSINADLSWTGGDPDVGDSVTYDVFFGTTSPPPKVFGNYSSTLYNLPTLAYSTVYYWKIVSWDNHGAHTTGPIWTFTTEPEPNSPPYVPSNPQPMNGAVDVDINADLSWTGGDPNLGDTVTYNISFGILGQMTQIASYQTSEMYELEPLSYETTYEWQIFARDNHGSQTIGPIWTFTTASIENHPPEQPTLVGPTEGMVGIIYTFSANASDPDGNQVFYNISWGDGNVSGWLGPYDSNLVVEVPYQWTAAGDYEVTVKAKDIYEAESVWSAALLVNISVFVRHVQINNIQPGYLYFRFLSDKSYAYIHLLEMLNISIIFGFSLAINATVSDSVHRVQFDVVRLFTGLQESDEDTDMSDGAYVDFLMSTGLVNITAHAYDINGSELGTDTLDFVLFIKPNFGGGVSQLNEALLQKRAATKATTGTLRPR